MANSTDLRESGARIEALLDASAAGGPVAKERAEELVRLVVDLYGSGLERLLDILDEAGALNQGLLRRLADDDLVAGLLLVHGLHPDTVVDRVERALIQVRPYLGSHGGDVELIEVSADGVVQLRMLGSCDGCASSAATLKLAVEGAIEAAAPEVTRIDVQQSGDDRTRSDRGSTAGFIPIDALAARLRTRPEPADAEGATWFPLPDAGGLAAGSASGRTLGGLELVVCRVAGTVYAYRDACGRCGSAIAGAALERRLGSGPSTAVLTCPTCRAHFAVQQAGKGLDEVTEHLAPLPVLVRDGIPQVAVPTAVPA